MILCVCMQYAIGGNIKGLTLGIVNHEVTTVNECLNNSLMAFDVRGFHCKIHKLSCMFIDELHDNVAKKVSGHWGIDQIIMFTSLEIF